MKVAHTSLHAVTLSESLESLTIRGAYNYARGQQVCFPVLRLENPHESLKSALSFSYPNLQHLTLDLFILDPEHGLLKVDPGSNWPQLKTLHLIQTNDMFSVCITEGSQRILHDLGKFEAQEISVTDIQPWSWPRCHLDWLIAPLTHRRTPIQRLKFCHFKIGDTRAFRTWPIDYAKSVAIQELELVNMKISRLSGDFDICETGWDIMPWLCRFANVVHVRNGSENT